jgi:hypothetical protein
MYTICFSFLCFAFLLNPLDSLAMKTRQINVPKSPSEMTRLVSMSLNQGHQGSRGRGRGRCWSSPDPCAPAELSHGSDPSNMTIALSSLTDHPSLGRTLLSEHHSQRMSRPTTTELGGREPRRGGGAGGGGGAGKGGKAGTHVVYTFEAPPP